LIYKYSYSIMNAMDTYTKSLSLSPIAQTALAHLTFDETGNGFVSKMPSLDRAVYVEVNKALEAFGGKWQRKIGGHVFSTDPRPQIHTLCGEGQIEIADDNFFETLPVTIDLLLDRADLPQKFIALEPSAGNGAIADQLRARGGTVSCFEIDETRRNTLIAKGYKVLGNDFMEAKPKPRFDRIVMNPPFSKGRDVAHVTRAYEWLAVNGRLVAVMSASVKFRKDSVYADFRAWLKSLGGTMEDLPAGSFKESGTDVNAVVITVSKSIADETLPTTLTTIKARASRTPRKARKVDNGVDPRSPAELIGEMQVTEAKIVDGLAELAAEIGAEKFSARDLAYLHAPKILHPGGETGHLISNVIPQARLALLKNGERDLATEEEALAYLSSASLCFPLDSDHAEIMFYLTDRVMTRWYGRNKIGELLGSEVWRLIGLKNPPKLSSYQEGLLRELRGKIRRSAEKHGAKSKRNNQRAIAGGGTTR